MGQEIVFKSLLKTFTTLAQNLFASFFVIIIPETCNVIKNPSGHSANIDSFCCALSVMTEQSMGSRSRELCLH